MWSDPDPTGPVPRSWGTDPARTRGILYYNILMVRLGKVVIGKLKKDNSILTVYFFVHQSELFILIFFCLLCFLFLMFIIAS